MRAKPRLAEGANMKTSRFARARAALGAALLLALQHCSIDDRQFDANPVNTPNEPGAGGTEGAAPTLATGGSTSQPLDARGEQGPEPVGLTAPDAPGLGSSEDGNAAALADAGAAACVEGSIEQCGPSAADSCAVAGDDANC
jgi:hypothetical protein